MVRAAGRVGGGALPLLELEGPVCAVDPGRAGADALAARAARRRSAGDRPQSTRLLLLDPRTLTDEEADEGAAAVARALKDTRSR